ncbi:hypothetical protein, partial [Psychroserpens sp.]|uniref:hypothetical protein n=1 Tax=Psychroserpens sp. TaxID=2020870 RepID=UPI00385FAA2F
MKLIITILVCFLTITTFAQPNGKMKERIKAQKIAFITEKLDLTTEEAQQFWPIYNAHEKEMEMLRINGREKRRNLNIETISDTEAKNALNDLLAFEKEQQELKADLVENLLKVIPAKKIIALMKV